MRFNKILFFAAGLLLMAGCSSPEKPAPASFWQQEPAYVIDAADDGFGRLIKAAKLAEQADPDDLDRIFFINSQKERVKRRTREAMRQLESALRMPINYQFISQPPGSPYPYQKGWRMLGRALIWDIEEAVQQEACAAAISRFKLATRFGFVLTGGGATDASLGLALIDEARSALLPSLSKMSTQQLDDMAESLTSLLRSRPDISRTFENERQNMRAGVQMLYDAFQKEDDKLLLRVFGSDGPMALKRYLMLKKEQRDTYFASIARQADEEATMLARLAKLPVAKRTSMPEPSRKEAWSRIARHILLSGRPLLEIYDQTLARTRLLVLRAEALKSLKHHRTVLNSLKRFPLEVTSDPYSGEPFILRAVETEFRIYSVGSNLRDDGGETNESGTDPDLVLSPNDR